MNAWPTDEQALGTDFRHSNSFSFSYQVKDGYQKRPSYVLLSLALRCIFSSKYLSFFVSHLASKASMPWPHLSNWPSPLVASQVIGARCQAPNAGCQVLLLVAKNSQAGNQLWTNQRQVVLDLSLARVIVLQLSAACASPGFLNCHTLSVFGQHRGISLKITGTGTETATRHFRCLTSAVFFWYSEQLPVLRDQAAMGLCKKKDYVLTTQAMSGVLMREEILRLNNHSPLRFQPPRPKQQRAIQQRLRVVNWAKTRDFQLN